MKTYILDWDKVETIKDLALALSAHFPPIGMRFEDEPGDEVPVKHLLTEMDERLIEMPDTGVMSARRNIARA